MTPFGLKLRQLRRQKGVTLQEQADVLGVSAAYISALEHGQRGKPSPAFVDQFEQTGSDHSSLFLLALSWGPLSASVFEKLAAGSFF